MWHALNEHGKDHCLLSPISGEKMQSGSFMKNCQAMEDLSLYPPGVAAEDEEGRGIQVNSTKRIYYALS